MSLALEEEGSPKNMLSRQLKLINVVPVDQSSKLDGNGFLGSDGWMPGDYGALESVWTLDGNWSPDGTLFDPPCCEAAAGTKF